MDSNLQYRAVNEEVLTAREVKFFGQLHQRDCRARRGVHQRRARAARARLALDGDGRFLAERCRSPRGRNRPRRVQVFGPLVRK